MTSPGELSSEVEQPFLADAEPVDASLSAGDGQITLPEAAGPENSQAAQPALGAVDLAVNQQVPAEALAAGDKAEGGNTDGQATDGAQPEGGQLVMAAADRLNELLLQPGPVSYPSPPAHSVRTGVRDEARIATPDQPPAAADYNFLDMLTVPEEVAIGGAARLHDEFGSGATPTIDLGVVRGVSRAVARVREQSASPKLSPDTGVAMVADADAEIAHEFEAMGPMPQEPADLEPLVDQLWATPPARSSSLRQPPLAVRPMSEGGIEAIIRQQGLGYGSKKKTAAWQAMYGQSATTLPGPEQAGFSFMQGRRKTDSVNPDAAGLSRGVSDTRWRAEQAQRDRHHQSPNTEPPTLRPWDPDPAELDDAAGRVAAKPYMTHLAAEGARDLFAQGREAEQYEWDRTYARAYGIGDRSGLEFPETPPPGIPTPGIQELLHCQLLAAHEAPSVAQAGVDSLVEQYRTDLYKWLHRLLALNHSPAVQQLMPVPVPLPLTAAQLEAIQSKAYETMETPSMVDARAHAEAAQQDRLATIAAWQQDAVFVRTGRVVGDPDQLSDARLLSLKDQNLEGIIGKLATEVADNQAKPVPDRSPAMMKKLRLLDRLINVGLSQGVDPSGLARKASLQARGRAGATAIGYDPQKLTVIVYNGPTPDLTTGYVAMHEEVEQVVTVNGHDHPEADRQLSEHHGISVLQGKPHLNPLITGLIHVVAPGGGFVKPGEILPRIPPNGALVVAGTPTETMLSARLLGLWRDGRLPRIVNALRLASGQVDVSSNGRLSPDSSYASPTAMLFLFDSE